MRRMRPTILRANSRRKSRLDGPTVPHSAQTPRYGSPMIVYSLM